MAAVLMFLIEVEVLLVCANVLRLLLVVKRLVVMCIAAVALALLLCWGFCWFM